MQIEDLLTPALMSAQVDQISTKKQALEIISKLISDADSRIKFSDVVEALQKRERLGSTSMGYGVAIPHARIVNLIRSTCVLVTLKSAIDFESAEVLHNQPVDILFALLVPEEASPEELEALSDITTKLKDKSYRDQLRSAVDAQQLYEAAVSQATQLI